MSDVIDIQRSQFLVTDHAAMRFVQRVMGQRVARETSERRAQFSRARVCIRQNLRGVAIGSQLNRDYRVKVHGVWYAIKNNAVITVI